MTQFWEFGGGLGDVIHQCYDGGYYNLLDEITSPVDIVIICHNPYAYELFEGHPKRALMNVRVFPYWTPDHNAAMRSHYGLPPVPSNIRNGLFPRRPDGMNLYLLQGDDVALSQIDSRYVVICQGAGLPSRELPIPLVHETIQHLVSMGFRCVISGRTFERSGRQEALKDYAGPGVINLIDRLSVPGSLQLIRNCTAMVTGHSALNIAGWWERKPQLLLYPEQVRQFHFMKKDQWSFGKEYPDTFQAVLEDSYGVKMAVDNFLAHMRFVAGQLPPMAPIIPMPDVSGIKLNWHNGRFTPEHDVRVLLHEISKTKGNIIEVGCNRGVTTLELALAFPDRLVYAVDCPWVGMCESQMWERVSFSEFCEFARDFPNVLPIMHPFETLRPELFHNVGVVFVDGNHTYHGCKRDTDLALKILGNRGGLIAWHDCHDGGPAWVNVNQVVDERNQLTCGRVWRVQDSWMAFEEVPPVS